MEASKIEIGQIWKWGKGIAWESPDHYIIITGYHPKHERFTVQMLSDENEQELVYPEETLLTNFERIS